MLDFEGIQQILPHRFPFLLLDRAIDISPGVSATAVRAVSGNEWFFQGHFPGYAVMPGVLILEAMAQTGALALLQGDDAGAVALLAGINKARFHRPVRPGDLLTFTVRLTKRRGAIGIGEATAVNGCDEKVASCELLFALDKSHAQA